MSVDERRRIPWLRITAESVAIVASILLAFLIDAAWDAQLQRAEEIGILRGLESEYVDLTSRLDEAAARYETFATEVRWLLNEAPTLSSLPIQRLDGALSAALWAGTFEPGTSVRSAMLASGRLELIRNQELQRLLSGWEARVSESTDDEIGMRDFAFQQLAPFLSAQGFEFGRVFQGIRADLTLRSDAEMESEYRRLLSDPQFRSLIQYRLHWLTVSRSNFRLVSLESAELLGLIREELQR